MIKALLGGTSHYEEQYTQSNGENCLAHWKIIGSAIVRREWEERKGEMCTNGKSGL